MGPTCVVVCLVALLASAEGSAPERAPAKARSIVLSKESVPDAVLVGEKGDMLVVPRVRIEQKRTARQVWEKKGTPAVTTYVTATDSPSQAVASAEAYLITLATVFDEGTPSGESLGDRAWHSGKFVLFTTDRCVVLVDGGEDFARTVLAVVKVRLSRHPPPESGPVPLGGGDLPGFSLAQERDWEWPVPVAMNPDEVTLRVQEWRDSEGGTWTTTVLQVVDRVQMYTTARAMAEREHATRLKVRDTANAPGPVLWMRDDGRVIVWPGGLLVTCVKSVGERLPDQARTRRFAKKVQEALNARVASATMT